MCFLASLPKSFNVVNSLSIPYFILPTIFIPPFQLNSFRLLAFGFELPAFSLELFCPFAFVPLYVYRKEEGIFLGFFWG
jgi:hypothetical protein